MKGSAKKMKESATKNDVLSNSSQKVSKNKNSPEDEEVQIERPITNLGRKLI